MKAKMLLIACAAIALICCTCCSDKPSKAAEMNRKADSTYRADSIALSNKYK